MFGVLFICRCMCVRVCMVEQRKQCLGAFVLITGVVSAIMLCKISAMTALMTVMTAMTVV